MLKNSVNHNHGDGVYHLKYKVCVSGSADTTHCDPSAVEKAREMGKLVAEHNMILITGATTGIPYWAAKGAKEAGGMVIGVSPAASKAAHVKSYRLPLDYHDVIVYTGFDYSGRNLLLARSSDAIITICGRIGTLNEFTIGFEDRKPQGILLGTGGMTDMIKEIIEKAHRGPGKLIFDSKPEGLLEKIIAVLESEEKEIDSSDYPAVKTARG
ncbi:MAG: hypothetical protein AAB655_00345 [Patescibacteria group bacterium]